MIRDEARVLLRAGLVGLLLPPAIGAVLVAIVSALADPVSAHAYLSFPFVRLVFGVAVRFAGPLGLVGAVTASGLALWWGRRGHHLCVIRRRLVAIGALLGASLGWVCSQWVFTLARDVLWAQLIFIGGGLASGAAGGLLSSSILGTPFERLTLRWTRPA